MANRGWRRGLLIGLGAIAVITGGAYALMRKSFPQLYADASVFDVSYDPPIGWNEEPPGPFTMFVYRHPKGLGTLRASKNEVQAAYNPTPELDTDGIAEHYVDITHANMPDWKAERLKDIATDSENFSLIKRTTKDKTVYTAFCSKGNTTVIVTLYAGGVAAKSVDNLLPEFHKLVGSFKLTPKTVELYD